MTFTLSNSTLTGMPTAIGITSPRIDGVSVGSGFPTNDGSGVWRLDPATAIGIAADWASLSSHELPRSVRVLPSDRTIAFSHGTGANATIDLWGIEEDGSYLNVRAPKGALGELRIIPFPRELADAVVLDMIAERSFEQNGLDLREIVNLVGKTGRVVFC